MTLITRKKIAIIGSGISGLSCAYLLAKKHDVTVLEAADTLGGHTATKTVKLTNGQYDVDTGFIVFNDRTYPHFLKLMALLKVEYQPTEMGFSVSNRQLNYEYSGTSVNGVFAQRKNLINIRHWIMLRDIVRFNKACTQLYEKNAIPTAITLGDYLKAENYSEYFTQHYILPMVSAIWSSGLDLAAAMPLIFFIRFFHNHGLLTVTEQPQWYTIKGGSKTYIEPLTASFKEHIHVNCKVMSIKRHMQGVIVTSSGFGEQFFDEVVLACHSDQALKLLADPSHAEHDILSAIPYKTNQVVLHSDTQLLPRSQRAWASWNYLMAGTDDESDTAALTYNMNMLQTLNAPVTFCVSVNADPHIDGRKIVGRYVYAHPQFTLESIAAQERWAEISGVAHTHYCGAYWRNGFHEDGLVSGIRVAQSLGATW